MSDIDPNSFTVKEMILVVMAKLDQLDGKLDAKAEASDLRVYERRITSLERDRIDPKEHQALVNASISRRALAGFAAALVALVPALNLVLNWANTT